MNTTKLAMTASIVALLVAGCSSNQAAPKPSVTSADVTACHDFGNEVIVHGATTTQAERLRLMDEVALAQNANLRRQANAMKAAIAAQNGSAELSAADSIARTCYALGLVSKSGQPT
jgi:urocanate hydratase